MRKGDESLLRPGVEIELRSLIAIAVANAMSGEYPFKSCINCKHFDMKNDADKCEKFNQKPPARIIMYSCPAHDDISDIPF